MTAAILNAAALFGSTFLLGGPVGIYASMRVHRKFFKRNTTKEHP